jgi:two-component system response regulator PilR (NtrC family)
MSVNCGAIPETLLESELFGHVRGAFTDAKGTRRGLFELAEGGTLLLDEVGEMPLTMQVKLLRVLQDKRVRPVGGSHETAVDVRVIAATNQDLDRAVNAGRFREDLFYRLNVIRIDLPPLRERREDIVPLAEHFRARFAAEQGRPVRGFTPDALARLESMEWPGNVRELENAVERAVTLANSEVLTAEAFPEEDMGPMVAPAELPDTGIDLESEVDSVRRRLIEEALRRSGGRRMEAARLLGVSFRSLRYYIKKYGIRTGSREPRE